MPTAYELGESIKESWPEDERTQLTFGADSGITFEGWLSAMSTRMPFLREFEVLQRRALALNLTEVLGDLLDDAQNRVSTSAAPKWLLELVKAWNSEGAKVITFNYDLLIERAVVTAGLKSVHKGSTKPTEVDGTDIVYPAPPIPFSGGWGESDSVGAFEESFQLIKLHGSLNWYASQGTAHDATTLAARDGRGFDGVAGITAGRTKVKTLYKRRLITPPVADKTAHYGTNLTLELWYAARLALQNASRVTLLGYSLPREDQVSTELLRELNESVGIEIVDLNPGVETDAGSISSRVALSGHRPTVRFSGANAIEQFALSLCESTSVRL